MKLANVLLIALMLVATVALAGEKVADTQNALPNYSTRGVITGSLTENSPTWNRIYGGSVSLDCASQVNDSSTDGQYFALFCITVSDDTPVEIIVDPAGTTLHDTVMALYCDPFDPADPSLNVVSYDDDGGDGLLSAFVAGDGITLTPGNQYFLVLSNFGVGDPDDMGDFVINTSDNIMECGTVATDAGNWDSLKANYR